MATPLALRAAAPQPLISVPLLAKSTVPVVTGEPELVTVAVNVTVWFDPEVNEGLGLDMRLVLVDAALAVAMLSDHPPSIPAPVPPPSPSAFSVANNFHVPLGSKPLKVLARVAEPVGAAFEKLGAGEGNVSFVAPFVKSLVKSAGLIVTDPLSPEALLVPRLDPKVESVVPVSERVTVSPLGASCGKRKPPAPVNRLSALPAGSSRSTLRSGRFPLVSTMLERVTVRSLIVPLSPETEMSEG